MSSTDPTRRPQGSAASDGPAAITNLTHELHTPLHGIIGMTGLLLESTLDASQRELAVAVQRSAEALLRVSEDLLDYALFAGGGARLREAPFGLHQVMADVAALLRERAAQKSLRLEVRPVQIQLRGDGGRIRQVLFRLVDNAIKFTEAGEVTLAAEVTLDEGDRVKIRMTVDDTGPGIPARARESLFEPFVQADAGTNRRHEGAGLGLAAAREIVESMGGRIGAEARPGGGTRFWVELMLPHVAVEGGEGLPPPATVRPGNLRVLVVDDNAAQRLVLRHAVQRCGHTCEVVADGGAALDLLARQPVDLILMDGAMPGLDGYETTRRIRSGAVSGVDPRVPIIGLAVYDLEADRQRGLDAGMTEVLACPVRIEEMQAAIDRTVFLPRALASAPAAAGPGPVLDPARIDYLSELQDEDSPGFVVQMIDLFLVESAQRVAQVRSGLQGGDLAAVLTAAHSLKGAAASIGAVALQARCAAIESAARAGRLEGAVQAALGFENDHGRLAMALDLEKKKRTP